MVNTFVTRIGDYRLSAQDLDYKRLGKQRVEAYQILNLCICLGIIESILGRPRTSPLQEWIKQVVAEYKRLGVTYYYLEVSKSLILYSESPIEGWREIKLGFVYHPAVRMWFGYEDSLREYIDAHIDVWVERGYSNTMQKYNVNGTKPYWLTEDFCRIHRSALVMKEPEHYLKNPDFQNLPAFIDYIWPVP